MQKMIAVCCVLTVACMAVGQEAGKNYEALRINQIQVIGSHNSYHAGLTPSVKAMLEASNPKILRGLDYGHPPIPQQLDAGLRQIEIDVFADSKGGLYSHPASERVLAALKLPPDPPYNTDRSMDKPGFKVMHVQDLDQHSTCTPLIQCLKDVLAWSRAHPQHVPLFILLEAKAGKPIAMPGAVTPEPFTAVVFDALDDEIRSVFSPGDMITPDQVRGAHATLPQAIADGGWPLLSQSRGKVVFLLDNRALTPVYTEGHPSLKGRVLFTNSNPGDSDAAFVEQNDGTEEAIAALVKQGYLVRTRADADTEEARTDSAGRRDHAIASGAQIISTDYPKSEPAKWPGSYFVALPNDAIARCNPVNAPRVCSLARRSTD